MVIKVYCSLYSLIFVFALLCLQACQPGIYPGANMNLLKSNAKTQAPSANFTVLQANIGNVDPVCILQVRGKLCHQEVENRIAQRIQQLKPDIVNLQEVLPDWMCRQGKVGGPGLACHQYQTRPVRDQVRRLLGSQYTIVCEPHHSWDCIGLRSDTVSVKPDEKGNICPTKGLCGTERLSAGDQKAVNSDQAYHPYYASTIESSLDDGFHITALDVVLKGQPLRLINAHPQSGIQSKQQQARSEQIKHMFLRFATQTRTLITGDLNLDPFRWNDSSVQTFNQFVDNYDSKGQLIAPKAFHYHSGPVEQPPVWPPRLTAEYRWPIPSSTLDHVLSNFARGTCRTLDGSEHLSGGKGTDHKALWCQLKF